MYKLYGYRVDSPYDKYDFSPYQTQGIYSDCNTRNCRRTSRTKKGLKKLYSWLLRIVSVIVIATIVSSILYSAMTDGNSFLKDLKKISMSSFFNDDTADNDSFKKSIKVENENVELDFFKNPYGFYYDNLEDIEKDIYRDIIENADKENLEIPKKLYVNKKATNDNLVNVAKAIIRECPVLTFASTGFISVNLNESVRNREGKLLAEISFGEVYDGKSQREKAKEFKQKIREILSYVPENATDYEKEKFFHDYIQTHCKYDTTYKKPYSQSPYGLLVKGEAVCAGYAKLFKILLDACSIDAIYATGYAYSGSEKQRHAWNQVKLDGEWYACDVTWDDPVILGLDGKEHEDNKQIYYDYFNITSQEIEKDHEPLYDYPECNGTKYAFKGKRLFGR